jgi:hypothetical protein
MVLLPERFRVLAPSAAVSDYRKRALSQGKNSQGTIPEADLSGQLRSTHYKPSQILKAPLRLRAARTALVYLTVLLGDVATASVRVVVFTFSVLALCGFFSGRCEPQSPMIRTLLHISRRLYFRDTSTTSDTQHYQGENWRQIEDGLSVPSATPVDLARMCNQHRYGLAQG